MTIRTVTYLLAFAFFVSYGCKKKDTAPVTEPAPATTGSNPDDLTPETAQYVKYDLNGTSYSYAPAASGTWFSGSGAQILMTGPPLNIASVYASYYNNNTPVFTIERNDSTREAGNSASNTLYVSMFKTGSYSYVSSYSDFNKRLGVTLSFKDSQNKTWSTRSNNGTFQSASTFTINKSISYMNGNFQTVKIKANFNCKVYNNNDSLQITNGEILISLFK